MKSKRTLSFLLLGAGVLGLLVCGLWGIVEPRRFMTAWHLAWVFAMSIPLGTLFLLLFADTVGSRWQEPIRPYANAVLKTLPVLLLASIPLYLNLSAVFPWANTQLAEGAEVIRGRGSFHHPMAFVLRTALYGGVFVALAFLLWRLPAGGRLRRAPLGLILYALATTFFAFDWIMSILPGWSSTIFGVYFFNGSVVGALSVLLFMAARERSFDGAPHVRHDVSKYLYVMMLFWGHVAFLQFLLIWFANIPEETHFYHLRSHGGHQMLTALVWALHVFLPLFLFMSARMKQMAKSALVFASMLFVSHALDLFWATYPSHYAVFSVRPVDVLAPVAMILILAGLIRLALPTAKSEATHV